MSSFYGMGKVLGTTKTSKRIILCILVCHCFFPRFCGWVDVGLSSRGDAEAIMAAEALLESRINISKVFTSLLSRANFTVSRVLEVCVDIFLKSYTIKACVRVSACVRVCHVI